MSYTKEQANQIINTMIRQMNGAGIARLDSMIGLKHYSYAINESGYVEFNFRFKSRAKNKANHCVIEYDAGADLYNMTFHSIRGTKCRVVSKHEGLYASMLRTTFERETAVYLMLLGWA